MPKSKKAKNKTKTSKPARAPRAKRAKAPRAKPAPRTASRPRPRSSGTERRADERLVECTIELLHAHDRAVAQSERQIGEHPTKARSYARLVARAGAETEWDAADFRRAVVVVRA